MMHNLNNSRENKGIKTAKIRLALIGAFFAFSFGALLSRAFYFNLKDNSKVEGVALRQYRTAVQKSTERGKILDSLGRELAINIPAESVFVDPRFVKDKKGSATTLSSILKIDTDKITELLSSNRKFVWIKRKISQSEASNIENASLPGIYLMTENSRSYPNANLAAPVLGICGQDAEGLFGIELEYNNLLLVFSVESGYKRDARGHIYLSPSTELNKPTPPNIELTIDRTIQYAAEKELREAVYKTNSKGGVVILLDVLNADILAMASMPTFDPNNFQKYPMDVFKNSAVADAFEPGSTFKTIVVANAIDSGIVSPSDIVDCGLGKLYIGKNIIRDAHPHGDLSVADVIKVSSNIGAAKIGTKIGKNRLSQALHSFGFGEPSGIELPGESAGILSSQWSDLERATISFGQGVAATPLQMTLAFAAIANGGELLKPHIVKRILTHDGQVIYQRTKEVRRRPIRPETASVMTSLLTRVVGEGGTGVLAASSDYQVAGKTGTAEKASAKGGYAEGKYYSSFIGYAPAENPRIAVYVALDEPKGSYYGGQIAAPVFKNMVDYTLRYLNVPSGIATTATNTTADIVNLAEGSPTPRRVLISGTEMWKIPDFTGLTMRDVLEGVGTSKLKLKFLGHGIAIRQSINAGSLVPSETECTIDFAPLM